MTKNFKEDFEKAGVQLLDDDEIALVTGGDSYDDWCWGDYCCYILYKHPDDKGEKGDACLYDYECVFVNMCSSLMDPLK